MSRIQPLSQLVEDDPLTCLTICKDSSTIRKLKMDADHSKAVGDVLKISNETIDRYLDNPSDRSARIEAFHDAKNLVRELQDGDHAFFGRIEHISRQTNYFHA